MDDITRMGREESFWQGRMKSLIPIKLPYENMDDDTDSKWIISEWLEPLLDFGIGDGQRMLLDAFVIYLARISGNTELHMGWTIERTDTQNHHCGPQSFVVPMIVAVSLDHPWESVSEVVNCELATLASNLTIPFESLSHCVSKQTVSYVQESWRIVVSLTDQTTVNPEELMVPDRMLILQIGESGGFRWVYNAAFLSSDVIERMSQHLRELVASFLESTDAPICKLNMLPENERTLLLKRYNSTEQTLPNSICIHKLFEDQAVLVPVATALIYKEKCITYAELNASANRIAHKLIELGVRPEKVVAVCVAKAPAKVVAILAVLKAGGACLPLDTTYPSHYLIDSMNDVVPNFLIADHHGRIALIDHDVSAMAVIDPDEWQSDIDVNPSVPDLTSKSLAYMLYTSGTTGKPKGVLVEHENVVHILEAVGGLGEFTSNDVWFQLHSVAFAYALLEFWAPLHLGGKLLLLPPEDARSPAVKQQLIVKHRVTVLTQTPTAFKAMVALQDGRESLDHLRYVIFSGESLNPVDLQHLFDKQGASLPIFINTFGTSETMFALGKVIDQRDTRKNNNIIGAPLTNVTVYLLDENGQLVPLGAVGELYISSRSVTRGYFDRPELTRARYMKDPIDESGGKRFYKTGDLAKYLPNGSLMLIGRNDRQIKIRGFRIEAGKIEVHLKNHCAVQDAIVIASGEESSKRLVAYVVAAAVDELPQRLYAHLAVCLPAYMIPAAFVRVETFTYSLNGKLSTRSLPPIDEMSLVRGSYEKPLGGNEVCLAHVWEEVLSIERVGRHDSFFALGGHSLLAVRVIEAMRSNGLTLEIGNVFKFPILSDLARTIQRNECSTVPVNLITPECMKIAPEMLPLIELTQSDIDKILATVPGGLSNVQDIYAVSPIQDGILFHHLVSTERDPYLITKILAFTNHDELILYLTAFQDVIDRHDILRTCFVWEGLSKPAQIVCRRAVMSITEQMLEANGVPVKERLLSLYGRGRNRIDLRVPPLIRAVVVRETNGRWILLCLIHHIICDERTSKAIDAEISALLIGNEMSLKSSIPYRNHIARLRRNIDEDNYVRLFTEMLSDIDEPTLPFGLVAEHNMSGKIAKHRTKLDSKLVFELRMYSGSMGVSLAAVCHLAWAVVVSRSSGKQQAVFDTVLSSRMRTRVESEFAIGLYINTLPIRFNIDDTPIRTSVRVAQTRLAHLLECEHISYASAQRYSDVASGTTLCSSLFNYRHRDPSIERKNVVPFQVLLEDSQSHYPLVLSINDNDLDLTLELDVMDELEPCRVSGYVQVALENLLVALDGLPEQGICSINILSQAEWSLLLQTENHSAKLEYNSECLHRVFEQQVSHRPSSTAIVFKDVTMTYSELNERANQLAHFLIEIGVKPETCVGICVSVSAGMLIGLLGILKAGGAYVPLDPLYPEQRLVDIITDASLHYFVADECGKLRLEEATITTTHLIDPNETSLQPTTNPIVESSGPDNIAYVIYTSGSTGRPKGVMVEHRNIVSLFNAGVSVFKFDMSDIWSLFHSTAFDFSVWEMWGALLHGGQLVLMSRDAVRSPEETYDVICNNGVTVFNQTPSSFKARVDMFVERGVPNDLRYIVIAGESLDVSILQPLYAKHGGNNLPQILNMYGITEATVFSTYKVLDQQEVVHSLNLIGRQLPHTQIYLLDANGRPVPPGAVGEIYIGGTGVARGYLKNPQLTNERFLPDTFNGCGRMRMYRTGDLAKYLAEGTLMFLGRSDQQIKVRGFRIETGEIEARLRSHPAVRDVIVTAIGENTEKRLVAYVVTDAQEDLQATLRSYVSSQIPDFMVPSAFVRLDAIPLTFSGKVDLRALPTPDDNAFAHETYEAPRAGIETTLSEIWSELLGIQRIGRSDSFFALGGNSLIAVQMVDRLRRYAHEVSVHDVFLHPTISELVRTVKTNRPVEVPENLITAESTRITPDMLPLIDLTQQDINRMVSEIPGGIINIQDIYALSPLQDGILFHHLLVSEEDPYVLMFNFTFSDRVILDRYISAFQIVTSRHDILRTGFFWKGLSTPAQVVLRRVTVPVTELSLPSDQGSVFDQLVHRYDRSSYRIDLHNPPLWHFVIARETDGTWVMIQLVHHIIMSHTMFEVINLEVRAYLTGAQDTLRSPAPFRNYIAHTRLAVDQRMHSKFFTDLLSDVNEPTLAFGLIEVRRDGSKTIESYYDLPDAFNNRLREQAKRLNMTPASFFHLAWALVLSRTSGQQKVVFGTVLFGKIRSGEGAPNDMELFINTLPIRVNIDETPVRECWRTTHETLARLLEHEDASLALAQRASGVSMGSPLFNALLNYRHNLQSDPIREIVDGVTFHGASERTNYPLALSVDVKGSNFSLTCQSAELIDPERICTYVHQASECLRTGLESARQVPVHSIDIIDESSIQSVSDSWGSGSKLQSDQPCIHQLFQMQVTRMRTATAIIYGTEHLTYVELNARANRLAHKLIEMGVVPDSPIGICVSVSTAMMIGILAILKAGGGYVPLDPEYPKRYLINVIQDVALKIIIADEVGFNKLETETMDVIFVDPNAFLSQPDRNPIVPELTSGNLAHVIYTSGSMGPPKGVLVEHRNIVSLCDATESSFKFDERDVWCLFHSIASNVSAWEIWGALLLGGKLVIMSRNDVRSAEATYDLLREHDVTVLNQTPSEFKARIDVFLDKGVPDILRYVIFAGESLDPSILKPLYAVLSRTLPRFVNMFGTTATTICSTYKILEEKDTLQSSSLIGGGLPHSSIYLLDAHRRHVPLGVVGELYIGGASVARGYLNRSKLNDDHFVPDTFNGYAGTQMYKTGDLARYLPDGTLVFLGRSEQQVKVRGLRIETSKIEACLKNHPVVRDAIVTAMGEGTEKRLVAYVVTEVQENLAALLQAHVSLEFSDFLVPPVIVRLDAIPLTLDGKLDRKALPALDNRTHSRTVYEPPRGNIETTLATIWRELLDVERIDRFDSFFGLGGDFLLSVKLIEVMRSQGLTANVRDLLKYPLLFDFAKIVTHYDSITEPQNPPTIATDRPTPEMFPLIDLKQSDIDRIISNVSGGFSDIQDIYDLSPLQNSILFHHLSSTDGDPYLTTKILAFSEYEQLRRYVIAFQAVIDRHDILRTSIFWDGISVPAQVVWRRVLLSSTEVTIEPETDSLSEELYRRYGPRRSRINLNQPPLIRCIAARESNGRWILLSLMHYIISYDDIATTVAAEISALFDKRESDLDPPIPFRNLITRVRQGLPETEHIRFFTEMLSDVIDPSVPFGLAEVQGEDAYFRRSEMVFDDELVNRLRDHVKILEVNVTSLCHVAWALVVYRTSGEVRTVFGTTLSDRMQTTEESLSVTWRFINILPIRLDIDGTTVRSSIRRMHKRLGQVAEHKHASLALAQRCSGIAPGTPLFSSLLHCRCSPPVRDDRIDPVAFEVLRSEGPTNYPLSICIDENDVDLKLNIQVLQQMDPFRISNFIHETLKNLSSALEEFPESPIYSAEVIPEAESRRLLDISKCTVVPTPDMICLHQLFERQVLLRPSSTALIYENENLTYSELNIRANQLAHTLIKLGVVPESLVGLCVSVSVSMLVGVLAILKAGGAYVPLDPTFPKQRLMDVITDAKLDITIADQIGRDQLRSAPGIFVDPENLSSRSVTNPIVQGLSCRNLAYVIYTSGSTGRPKGVMVEHRNAVRLFESAKSPFDFDEKDVWCVCHSIAFDFSVWEIWAAWCSGSVSVLIPREVVRSPQALHDLVCEHHVTVLNQTPSAFDTCVDRFIQKPVRDHLRLVTLGGEALDPKVLQSLFTERSICIPRVLTLYGPTETSVLIAFKELYRHNFLNCSNIIGTALTDTSMYLLDVHGRLVPDGVVGEIHVGGASVTRGYLNRPDLTEVRFLENPFDDCMESRMYKTGDLGRYLPDGDLVFVGRIDDQVKIRGFRVEPGEIEACLVTYPEIKRAAVLSFGDAPNSYLVAYIVTEARDDIADCVREHLSSMLPDHMIPLRYVCLDSLPLTSNFKLDRNALPSFEAGAIAHKAYESPISNTELMLATIWSQLLKIDMVGRNDNFFALGGHSLIATQMINLAADRGIICNLNDVFQYPVLSHLASKVISDSTTQRNHVAVPIRSSGTEPPLFFVPTGLGDFSHVYPLSDHIRSSVPIYALPWPNFQDEQISSLEEVASRMIRIMKAVQKEGPYRVCGYSSGGILSYAIAHMLEENHELVTFVGLVDTAFPDSADGGINLKRRFYYASLITTPNLKRVKDMVRLSSTSDDMSMSDFIAAAKKLQLCPLDLHSDSYAQELEQNFKYHELVNTYQPPDMKVPVHQFNAIDSRIFMTSIEAEFAYLCENMVTDWTPKLPNTTFKITGIPGNHGSMIDHRENRLILGQIISDAISF